MGKRDHEIEEGLQEYFEHKNPIIDPERGQISWPTLFSILHTESLEDFDDNSPLDEEGNLCVEWLRDWKTGKLRKEIFGKIRTYKVWEKTYDTIRVIWSNAVFIVDFENRKNFPWCEKWLPGGISSVDSFWDKEIIIFGRSDDYVCIDSDGKQIGETCVKIQKIKYWNIDILEFSSRINPDYEVNDLRTKKSYLWSNGNFYQPLIQQKGDTKFVSFKKIPNILKKPTEPKIINIENNFENRELDFVQ